MNPEPKAKPTAAAKSKPIRVIAVTSGKGGVGKTNVAANLAVVLAKEGRKVMIWDADLGLANIDILLGLKTEFNIHHLFEGKKTLREILVEGPAGIKIMPASSGIQELVHLAEEQKMRLLSELDHFDEELDFLLVDTGAGISSNVMYFNLAAQERIVVVTPEPTSITDAYALIKIMATRYNERRFMILPNMVSGDKEAKAVFSLLAAVADKHLDSISLDYLGYIPRDEKLVRAVLRQKTIVEAFPTSPASKNFQEVAKRLLKPSRDASLDGGIKFFGRRILRV